MATTKRSTKKPAPRTLRGATKKTRRPASKPARAVAKKARSAPKASRNATREGTRRNSRLDAIAELKRDHRDIERLFKRFEKAGAGAHRAKRHIVDSVIEQLSRHAEIEELVMYPAIRREVASAETEVLEALEEHHSVKITLRELDYLDESHERFDAKMTVLIEHVRQHVADEERELFPQVRNALGRQRLLELGAQLRDARPRVPTRPHPATPDEPPANALLGGAVAVIDRARTVGQRVVDRVRDE